MFPKEMLKRYATQVENPQIQARLVEEIEKIRYRAGGQIEVAADSEVEHAFSQAGATDLYADFRKRMKEFLDEEELFTLDEDIRATGVDKFLEHLPRRK